MKIIPVLLFVVLLYGVGCQHQTINLQDQSIHSQNIENQKPTSDESAKYIDLSEFYVGEDTFEDEDYRLTKQFKSHPDLADKAQTVEYAVLQKNNKKIETFDRINHPLSVIDFGSFSFLGKTEKQIFISQTAPRSGNHWIISLKPKYQVVFDSNEFEVGGEDFQTVDLDKDGVYELSFANYISLKLNSKTLAQSVPFTEVIFKFDPTLNKYLPANPQFAIYLLRDVDEQTKLIKTENSDVRYADILNITLKYIYAGKEKEAWEFFDKQYNFEDKEARKTAVKSALDKDVIYKSLKKIHA